MILNKVKLSVMGIFAVLLLVLPVFMARHAWAEIPEETKNAACEGIGAAGAECNNGSAGDSVDNIIATVVNILSWVVGVAAVIMVIIGGFRYVISHGDSNSIAAAKNTIMYAIIGLVVAAIAQILVQFVLGKVTDAPTTSQGANGTVIVHCTDGHNVSLTSPSSGITPAQACAQ